VTADEFASARDAFRSDCVGEYQIMPPAVAVIDLACALLERHPLRAYDAIHLASALTAQQFLATEGHPPLVFLSSDDRLARAASAEGLDTDNPNRHP
jgi:predicted nucleic acid-binding protein